MALLLGAGVFWIDAEDHDWDEVRSAAARMGARIHAEDGLGRAIEQIEHRAGQP